MELTLIVLLEAKFGSSIPFGEYWIGINDGIKKEEFSLNNKGGTSIRSDYT